MIRISHVDHCQLLLCGDYTLFSMIVSFVFTRTSYWNLNTPYFYTYFQCAIDKALSKNEIYAKESYNERFVFIEWRIMWHFIIVIYVWAIHLSMLTNINHISGSSDAFF